MIRKSYFKKIKYNFRYERDTLTHYTITLNIMMNKIICHCNGNILNHEVMKINEDFHTIKVKLYNTMSNSYLEGYW